METNNTFGSVMVQAYNRAAVDAVKKLIENESDGLIYLFGPSGIGKTQLVHEVIRKAKANNPEIRILSDDTNALGVQVEYAVKKNMLDALKETYKNMDLVILEDFDEAGLGIVIGDFLADIFEHLVQNKKRIILTSSFCPDLDCFSSERLRTTLNLFKVVGFEIPD